MKINGKSLAWAMILFAFFLSFVFVETDVVDKVTSEPPTLHSIFSLIVYFGLWFLVTWRFVKNMEEAFE